jgi:hypothetical protein
MMTVTLLLVASMLQSGTPSMNTIDSGQNSALTTARQVVVRSAQEWRDLWPTVSSTRPMPAVDFSKEMVVGVFLGQRSTGGYSVKILRTREEKGTLVVEYREGRPAAGTLTAQVITAPYQIATLPTFAGEVRFEKVE